MQVEGHVLACEGTMCLCRLNWNGDMGGEDVVDDYICESGVGVVVAYGDTHTVEGVCSVAGK